MSKGGRNSGPRIDLRGQKFNRLTFIDWVEGMRWRCLCDCGKEVIRVNAYVKNGSIKSCGCLDREATVARNTTHGLSRHPLYYTWAGMIARCENPNHASYHNYGGRGIKVDPRWRNDFAAFVADMGERPPGFSIERDDGDKDYGPGNCRWASRPEQSRNTRRNHFITHGGETLTVRDWEIRRGLRKGTLQRRVDLGWPDEKVVSEPIRPGKPLECRQ